MVRACIVIYCESRLPPVVAAVAVVVTQLKGQIMQTRYVFPLKVLPWETLVTDAGVNLKPGPQMKAIGYIPVYESLQELVENFGNDCPSGTFTGEPASDK